MKNKYRIAERVIEINSIYPRIHEMSEDYLHDGDIDFIVSCSDADIEFEREKSRQQDIIFGRKSREWSNSYLEHWLYTGRSLKKCRNLHSFVSRFCSDD